MKAMAAIAIVSVLWTTIQILAAAEPNDPAAAIPVRGIHLFAPAKKDLPGALELIRKSLPKEGVNTLILEFNYSYDFKSHAEFADPSALDKEDVRKIVAACRDSGVELIPQINCLGHQSWAKQTGRLLQKHPEFDETPGKYPENKGIYCRSYCPLNPKVHEVLFDLIDELAKACEAKAFHVGMDEVFILGDPNCPRCAGKGPAELFAGEVNSLHDHLKSIGCRTWMWGDRFLDGNTTKIGQWEASTNGTHSAIEHVPKDIVICDWHYESAPETARYFAEKGFDVVSCPWRKAAVAKAQLAQVRKIRADKEKPASGHALGLVQTTWCGFAPFLAAYGKPPTATAATAPAKDAASEAAECFRALFKAIREAR